MATILIVEDQPENQELYADIVLRIARELDVQFEIRLASTFEKAKRILETESDTPEKAPALILLDMEIPYHGRMNERGGYYLMEFFHAKFADTLWVPLTATIDLHRREALRETSLFDDLQRLRPFAILPKGRASDLKGVVYRALRLIQELTKKEPQSEQTTWNDTVTAYDGHYYVLSNQRVIQEIRSAAQTTQGILLFGKPGTGKAATARRIHHLSSLCNGPFVPVDGTIDAALLQEYLFPPERREDNVADSQSLLDQSQDGILYISSIDQMGGRGKEECLKLQGSLLYHLRSSRYRVRLIGGIDHNRESFTSEGLLSELIDPMISLELPPLCERKDDIPLLVDVFFHKINHERAEKVMKSKEIIDRSSIYKLLQKENWLDCNVFQLYSVVQKVFSDTLTSAVTLEDFELALGMRSSGEQKKGTLTRSSGSPIIITDEYLLKFGIH